jgi:hypothetical protein
MRARLELGKVLLHIFASPFGLVKFKHFFCRYLNEFVSTFERYWINNLPYSPRALGLILMYGAQDLSNNYLTQY